MYASQGASDIERTVLNHYNLQSSFPNQWPKELDESDEDDEDRKGAVRRSRSRYSALERAASDRRTLIPGSQQTRDGRANLVQKDEPDPLGGPRSVIASLRQRGLPIEQDVKLRNRFLLSSTTFSPAYFLSQTHSDASTTDLIQGLKYLESSIDQKSASLKVLVETNFERFVRAKATIDNVYTEMRNQGMEQPQTSAGPPSPKGIRHSRQVSRSSGIHQRITSTGSATAPQPPPQPSKNALRKETEYGVKGIKGPLLEVSQRAEDVWGPALEGRQREASLKAVAEAIEKDRSLYDLGSDLNIAAQQKNYEKVVDLYGQARARATEAARIGENASQTGRPLTDDQIHTLLVTGRMWADVQEQVRVLKRDIWRRLSSLQKSYPPSHPGQTDEHMELIAVLLELGVDDNPIWVWLLSRYDNLKNKIVAVTDRSKMEIEVLRRRLTHTEPPVPVLAASYLRSATREPPEAIDDEQILDFWKTVSIYVNKLLSLTDGLLGEVLDFWDSAKHFIDGSKEKSLPTGYNGESKKHHRLSDAGVRDLSNGAAELISLLRDALHALLAEKPTEDISSMFSAATNGTPRTPATPIFSPSEGKLANIDEKSLPPPSSKKGELWDDFAFWPPHSNALSAVTHISKMLVALGSGTGEMLSIDPVLRNNNLCESIRMLTNTARERCLIVVCMAWGKDSENCRQLEDWKGSVERRNTTRLPIYFLSYERTVLNGLQKVLYFSEGITKPTTRSLVAAPSAQNIQLIRKQFAESVLAILRGMLQNAEQVTTAHADEWVSTSSIANRSSIDADLDSTSYSIDASDHNVRLLLTMSNLKTMQAEQIPLLVKLFETTFTTKLAEESTQINDRFGEVDKHLFQSYTKPTVLHISRAVKEGINSPTWEPKTTRPEQVSPHVYASLMVLVNVHTEVSTAIGISSATNTNNLLHEILSYLLENMSQALLDGFKDRQPNRYSLAALIQATLDTEFIAQTMSQYASKRVGEIQNEIYVELDKRTTNDARSDLQKELGVMRGVLKKLREDSRNSFSCFKRTRGGDKDRPRTGERRPSQPA